MEKDFDTWNENKKRIDSLPTSQYPHVREIWWCALGLNVGVEVDGKHRNFERPVLVMRVYNKDSLIVLPLTSKWKEDPFHYKIQVHGRPIWVKLTQMRVISSKRLLRRIEVLPPKEFENLRTSWIALL